MHQPPQGYLAPGADPVAQALAVAEIATLTGEFEKPKYFAYKASICAHSRSRQPGCNQCIDVCSTAAIVADGDHVKVEPQLCMGCGACATVCPSGAMSYAYPAVPDLGAQIRTLLATYAKAGGRDACLLLHAEDGRAAIADLARRGRGLPARVIPFEVHHVASVGLDVWLAALAHGASQIAVLTTGAEAPQYREALRTADGLRRHDRPGARLPGHASHAWSTATRAALDAALWSWTPALTVRVPATFAFTADKRSTAALAIEHLARHAPVPQREIALARRRALRHDRRRPRRVHDVPRLRRRLSRRRDSRQSGGAAALVHRDEVRPVRHLRGDVPRGCHHPRAAALAGARSAAAARGQRSRRRQLHLRAASRSARKR